MRCEKLINQKYVCIKDFEVYLYDYSAEKIKEIWTVEKGSKWILDNFHIVNRKDKVALLESCGNYKYNYISVMANDLNKKFKETE